MELGFVRSIVMTNDYIYEFVLLEIVNCLVTNEFIIFESVTVRLIYIHNLLRP